MSTSSLHEVSSVFRDTITGRIATIESLLAITPDTITITLRVPATQETFTLCVPRDASTAALPDAVHRSYEARARQR